MSVVAPDLEAASAQEVLAYAVERFHPRLTMACSFQKEESVLIHMLMAIEPEARVFTIAQRPIRARAHTTEPAKICAPSSIRASRAT